MNNSYLDKMASNELMELRTKVLKALFKNKDLEREGNFLQHFDERLQFLIGAPYRETVDMNLIFKQEGQDKVFDVEESVSYTCRKMGDRIQDEISWGTFLDYEVDEIKDFSVEIRVPHNFFQSPDFKAKFPEVLEPIVRVSTKIDHIRLFLTF